MYRARTFLLESGGGGNTIHVAFNIFSEAYRYCRKGRGGRSSAPPLTHHQSWNF